MAEPLIPVFGMELMKMLFSTNWHLRAKAVEETERELKLGTKSKLLGNLP